MRHLVTPGLTCIWQTTSRVEHRPPSSRSHDAGPRLHPQSPPRDSTVSSSLRPSCPYCVPKEPIDLETLDLHNRYRIRWHGVDDRPGRTRLERQRLRHHGRAYPQASEGVAPYREAGIEEALHKHLANGRLAFFESLEDATKDAELIIVAVGTPAREDGSADLRRSTP